MSYKVRIQLVIESAHEQEQPTNDAVVLCLVGDKITTGCDTNKQRQDFGYLFLYVERLEKLQESTVSLRFLLIRAIAIFDAAVAIILHIFSLVQRIFQEVFADDRLAEASRKKFNFNIRMSRNFFEEPFCNMHIPLPIMCIRHLEVFDHVRVRRSLLQFDLVQHMHLSEVLFLRRWEELFNKEILQRRVIDELPVESLEVLTRFLALTWQPVPSNKLGNIKHLLP